MTDPMSDFRRAVLEDMFQSVFTKIQNFVAGSNQTDFVLDGDDNNVTYDVPFVWVNGVRKLQSEVSWVNATTVRLSSAPGLGKNVKILVALGGNSGYLLRNGSLAMTSDLDMAGFTIKNVGQGSEDDDVAIREELDFSGLSSIYLAKAGGTMSGILAMGGKKIIGGAVGVDATDFVIKSQLDAIFPAGIMTEFAGNSDRVPSGWLLCDGAAVSRTTYASLFTAINILWGAGDTSTTFNVPDMRGYFPRGLSSDPAIDPDGAGRVIGSLQADKVGPHQHPSVWYQAIGGGSAGAPYGWNSGGTVQDASKIPANTVAESGSAIESRPKNKAVNYIIKY